VNQRQASAVGFIEFVRVLVALYASGRVLPRFVRGVSRAFVVQIQLCYDVRIAELIGSDADLLFRDDEVPGGAPVGLPDRLHDSLRNQV